MNEKRKYIRSVKKSFQILGKEEKDYLKNLKHQIENSTEEDLTYDQLVKRFGDPKDLVLAYYENVDTSDFTSKIRWKKLMAIILGIVVVMAIAAIIVFIMTYIDSQNQNIDNVEIIIETLE